MIQIYSLLVLISVCTAEELGSGMIQSDLEKEDNTFTYNVSCKWKYKMVGKTNEGILILHGIQKTFETFHDICHKEPVINYGVGGHDFTGERGFHEILDNFCELGFFIILSFNTKRPNTLLFKCKRTELIEQH